MCQRGILSALLVAAVASVSGCGRSDAVAVYKVTGTIKLNGEPMKGGGAIAFMPPDGMAGKAAGGEIKPDGTYTVTTYEPGDGSMAGEFRVVITQTTVEEPESGIDGSGERIKKPIQLVTPPFHIPAIYGDLMKSPLTAKVEAKDANQIDFDLKKP
jgi:hypothetical protein